jgi:hypothetical protein
MCCCSTAVEMCHDVMCRVMLCRVVACRPCHDLRTICRYLLPPRRAS